jgi:putative peptide zinc metalloprotease protein
VLELVLPDHRRVALTGELTIGRAATCAVRLQDPTVSRVHARIRPGPVLEDAGSTYGTWLNGLRVRSATPLASGAVIRVGDCELRVQRAPRADEAGATVVVPSVATTRIDDRPRLRSGYALKRLAAAEGTRRWVLKDLRSGAFVRLDTPDAELLTLLDGSRSLEELQAEALRRSGPDGAQRLPLLLAALAERGLLSGTTAPTAPRLRGWRRLVAPRVWAWPGAGRLFERVYRAGGRVLLRPPVLAALLLVACCGLVAFWILVAARYGTPFVVAHKVGVGAVVFVLGRLALAAVHETAHGLVMTAFGRPVREAGFKLVLVFPYVYVDTSDAWFEPRRHRVAISAAGPASDAVLGGTFALACLVWPPGALRDVFFQLACGGYLGAFFNLNPIAPRDGRQIAMDLLHDRALRVVRIVWLVLGTAVSAALLGRWVH